MVEGALEAAVSWVGAAAALRALVVVAAARLPARAAPLVAIGAEWLGQRPALGEVQAAPLEATKYILAWASTAAGLEAFFVLRAALLPIIGPRAEPLVRVCAVALVQAALRIMHTLALVASMILGGAAA